MLSAIGSLPGNILATPTVFLDIYFVPPPDASCYGCRRFICAPAHVASLRAQGSSACTAATSRDDFTRGAMISSFLAPKAFHCCIRFSYARRHTSDATHDCSSISFCGRHRHRAAVPPVLAEMMTFRHKILHIFFYFD